MCFICVDLSTTHDWSKKKEQAEICLFDHLQTTYWAEIYVKVDTVYNLWLVKNKQ